MNEATSVDAPEHEGEPVLSAHPSIRMVPKGRLAPMLFWAGLLGGVVGTFVTTMLIRGGDLYRDAPWGAVTLGLILIGCYPGMAFAIPSALLARWVERAWEQVPVTIAANLRSATFGLSCVFAGGCVAFVLLVLRRA
jgi:hypothetical protein